MDVTNIETNKNVLRRHNLESQFKGEMKEYVEAKLVGLRLVRKKVGVSSVLHVVSMEKKLDLT